MSPLNFDKLTQIHTSKMLASGLILSVFFLEHLNCAPISEPESEYDIDKLDNEKFFPLGDDTMIQGRMEDTPPEDIDQELHQQSVVASSSSFEEDQSFEEANVAESEIESQAPLTRLRATQGFQKVTPAPNGHMIKHVKENGEVEWFDDRFTMSPNLIGRMQGADIGSIIASAIGK